MKFNIRKRAKRLKRQTQLHVVTHFKVKVPIIYKRIPAKNSEDGACYDPHGKNARILVEKSLKKHRKLNVLIEEITHAFFYDLPEYKVRKFSAQLGKVIYNQFIKK